FWRPGDDARKGVSAAIGISLSSGRASARTGQSGVGAPPDLPPPAPPTTITGNAADVVQTALESLGTPYVWGGTADNGFDCSGLVQYAYGQHGVRVPRMSRDQAHTGAEVAPVVDALRPGDILLFSARPGSGVTHVGMYVGELKFIHSSARGVKLSATGSGGGGIRSALPCKAAVPPLRMCCRSRSVTPTPAPRSGCTSAWPTPGPGALWQRCRRRSTPWGARSRHGPGQSSIP